MSFAYVQAATIKSLINVAFHVLQGSVQFVKHPW